MQSSIRTVAVLNLNGLRKVEMENILKFLLRMLRSDGIGGRTI